MCFTCMLSESIGFLKKGLLSALCLYALQPVSNDLVCNLDLMKSLFDVSNEITSEIINHIE